MTKIVDTSKLDFDSIRDNLKQFMSQQSEFTDYDFEGSGISTLIDLLAYNTHMNALVAHMSLNETFLSTAKARASVVSHAQALGYVPRSVTAPQALVSLSVIGSDISPNGLTIPRGYTFKGKINSQSYTYTVLQPISTYKYTEQVFNTNRTRHMYQFDNVVAYEGELITQRYGVDALVERQAIEIYSTKIDTSTLSVRVYDTSTSTTYTDYTLYSAIEDTTSQSAIFFLRENPFGNYEIYFGDGYIGQKLESDNVIEVQYIDTNGKASNDIKQLTAVDSLSGLTNITTTMVEPLTFGGKDRETIESIRYNSAVSYATQNRAVTAADYKSLILRQFTNIKDVAVWGGEDASPPVYGKVYIAPALYSQQRATESLKADIKTYLRYRNVGSVLAEIVDAEYNYVILECEFKFDPRVSKLGLGEVESAVRQSILSYNESELGRFDGIMRQSNLLTKIDQTDNGITSSIIRTKVYKNVIPNPLITERYVLDFPVPIYRSTSTESVVETSSFYFNNRLVRLYDEIGDTVDIRKLYVYDVLRAEKDTSYKNVGYVDMDNGLVVIENIQFDNSNTVQVIAQPNTYDITPKYQQLITILTGDIFITGSEDTVEKYSVKGLSDFNASTRH